MDRGKSKKIITILDKGKRQMVPEDVVREGKKKKLSSYVNEDRLHLQPISGSRIPIAVHPCSALPLSLQLMPASQDATDQERISATPTLIDGTEALVLKRGTTRSRCRRSRRTIFDRLSEFIKALHIPVSKYQTASQDSTDQEIISATPSLIDGTEALVASHLTTATVRANRCRRTSFLDLPTMDKVQRDTTLGVQHATTGMRTSRVRRLSFSKLVPFIQKESSTFVQLCKKKLPISGKRMAKQAIDVARRKKTRKMLTTEERKILQSIDTARRRVARASQTLEKRRAEKDKEIAHQRKVRERENIDNIRVRRTLDTARRRPAREQLKRTGKALNRSMEYDRQMQKKKGLTDEERVNQQALHGAERRRRHQERSATQRARDKLNNSARKIASRTSQRVRDNTAGTENRQPEIFDDIPIVTNAQRFRGSIFDTAWVGCEECRRYFPDLKIARGLCSSCVTDKRGNSHTFMYSAANLMDPGVVPIQLTRLSDLERMLIARVHPMMSVYRVKGQQYKYSGNIINFAQDVNAIAAVLPPRAADLSSILIVNRTGTHVTKEFRVRRHFVREALVWLKTNSLYYHDIIIDNVSLDELPIDGTPENIPQCRRNVVEEKIETTNGSFEELDFQRPPELHNEDVCIDDFQAVGTISVEPQHNQQNCIRRVLQVPDVDRTIAHMPLSNEVIDEFSTPGYIAMVFPTLFPLGLADLRQARPRKIDPSDYFQYLIKFHDGRFAKDSRFRYFAWNSLSRWRALALGDVYVRKNPMDRDLSIQEIKNMISSGDKQLANRISYYAKSIRGTRAYWYSRLNELTSMVKQLGAPTIFFTLSAADLQWPELYSLLDPFNEIQKLTPVEKRRKRVKLLNKNPSIAAWFFQHRVDIFLKEFLVPQFSVVDYWYRYEWQNRGSGHVHGFLWLQDSPDVSQISTNVTDRMRVIQYFERLVCTENPDPTMSVPMEDHPCARLVEVETNLDFDDIDYAALVNWVMRHSICGTYCKRLHRTTKQMACRFRYPFEIQEQPEIIEEPPNSNIYRFVGRRNDPLVCSHNRQVLQSWRANIDWSPVLSLQSVVNYIGKYAAKPEPASKSFTDILHGIVEDLRRPCQSARSAIKRLLMKSVSERDISAQEVCHLLMGYPLTRSSRKFVLLNLSERSILSSTIKRRKCGEEGEVGADPNFFGRYMERPSEYEGTSLLLMAKKHYFLSRRWHTSRIDAIVRVVPEIDKDITENTEKWEAYYRQKVLLNHHYRSLEEAKGDFNSWSARYNNLGFDENQPMDLPEPRADDFEEELQADIVMEEFQREEWMMAAAMGPIFDDGQLVQLGMRDLDISHNWEETLTRYPNIDAERKFVHNQLRNGQDTVIEVTNNSLLVPHCELSFEQRLAHELVVNSLQDSKPIRLIVCGGAGTGKSTLINAIVKSVNAIVGTIKAVRIMAPTGVAAFNIGGSTIHHELLISATRHPCQPYKNLTGDVCQRMQEDFKNTKLIIIDEYSMLGRAMLANIDLRCRDIFAKNEPFGDVSVVLVGDMRQLPLVCDSSLYVVGGKTMQIHGAISYACFDNCIRLSHIFRQAGDEQASFREALERLSDGTSTINDWNLFRTRDFSLLTTDDVGRFRYALRLFPTKQAANDYNCDRLLQLGKPIARITSKNNNQTASNATAEEAKGLDLLLCLSVGARVMLRANLATYNGLVNGAMGTIADIVYASGCRSPNDMPYAVLVDFDNYRGPSFRPGTNIIPITPQTSSWKASCGTSCQRTQIPLILCWAITIHKSQGLTLDRAVVDIGDRERLGLTFVALSRTRKLCDLAFSPMFSFERLQKIGKCSGMKGRLQEEERLRLMVS